MKYAIPVKYVKLICFVVLWPSGFALAETPSTIQEIVNQSVQSQAQNNTTEEIWDWLQLTSGEWLKGEFKSLYKSELEFDSDNLGLLTFDFEDVQYLKSSHYHSIRIEGYNSEFNGNIILTDEKLTVSVNEQQETFPRNQIIAIATASERELDLWNGKISFGTNFKRGNTRQQDTNAMFFARRRSAISRFRTDFLGQSSTVEGERITDNQRLSGAYDRFVRQHFFYRPLSIEIMRDPFQNIALRWTYGASIGHYLIDNSTTEWDYTVGLGFQRTRFESVQENQDESSKSGAFIFSTNFDTELTSDTDITMLYRMQLANKEAGGYAHHALISIDYEFIGDLEIGISSIWDYVDSPEKNADGEEPDQNDMRLVFNITYEFN